MKAERWLKSQPVANGNSVSHSAAHTGPPWLNKRKHVKVFKERKSVFSYLFETNTHVSGMSNLLVIQAMFCFSFLLLRDSIIAGRPSIELTMEKAMFGIPHDWLTFACVELIQLAGACLVHVGFMVWMHAHKRGGRITDVIFLSLYAAYELITMAAVWKVAYIFPPVFKFISALEHLRLTMKSYSFIRENASKVLYPWHKDDESGPAVWYEGQMEPSVGTFSKYLYFLFAPTLVYRDNYPRIKGAIMWRNVFAYGMQFLASVYTAHVLYAEVLFPSSFVVRDLFNVYLACLLLGPFMVALCFLIVLHAWHHLAAEVARFADREFYTDWWNSESYSVYYRKWNVVVHDWLSAYVYQDFKTISNSRFGAALLTFFFSSIMHDYLAMFTMEFFVPIFLVMFTGIGSVMFLVRPKSSWLAQILTVAGLCLGVAIIECVYLTELAARHYCSLPPNVTSYFTYRTAHCYRVFN